MLTPDAIQSREFLVSLRGYDRDEVHAFLEEVAADMGALLAQVETGGVPSSTVPAGPAASADVDASGMFAHIAAETRRVLEAAHEAGEDIKRRARADADRELAAARELAEQEVSEAISRRDALQEAITDLEQRRGEILERLRAAATAITATVDAVDQAVLDGPTVVSDPAVVGAAVSEDGLTPAGGTGGAGDTGEAGDPAAGETGDAPIADEAPAVHFDDAAAASDIGVQADLSPDAEHPAGPEARADAGPDQDRAGEDGVDVGGHPDEEAARAGGRTGGDPADHAG